MINYIGVKQIKAEPLNRKEYNELRGWDMPADENGDDEGYLVKYKDGYISWGPKKQFEDAYREIKGELQFGQALEILNAGGRVCRKSDTAFSFIVMMSGMTLPPYNDQSTERKVNDRTAKWIGKDKPLVTTPYLAAMTVEGKWMPGWTPTQDDIFAKDWVLVTED